MGVGQHGAAHIVANSQARRSPDCVETRQMSRQVGSMSRSSAASLAASMIISLPGGRRPSASRLSKSASSDLSAYTRRARRIARANAPAISARRSARRSAPSSTAARLARDHAEADVRPTGSLRQRRWRCPGRPEQVPPPIRGQAEDRQSVPTKSLRHRGSSMPHRHRARDIGWAMQADSRLSGRDTRALAAEGLPQLERQAAGRGTRRSSEAEPCSLGADEPFLHVDRPRHPRRPAGLPGARRAHRGGFGAPDRRQRHPRGLRRDPLSGRPARRDTDSARTAHGGAAGPRRRDEFDVVVPIGIAASADRERTDSPRDESGCRPRAPDARRDHASPGGAHGHLGRDRRRGGWRSVPPVTATLLDGVAQAGIDEVASVVPDGAGEQIVRRVRSEVWSRPIDGTSTCPRAPRSRRSASGSSATTRCGCTRRAPGPASPRRAATCS